MKIINTILNGNHFVDFFEISSFFSQTGAHLSEQKNFIFCVHYYLSLELYLVPNALRM